MLYFTGSKQHNIELRQRSIDRDLLLNEYALEDPETGDKVSSRTETAVYKALGLRFIPPELREGVGEIAAADTGPCRDWSRWTTSAAISTFTQPGLETAEVH